MHLACSWTRNFACLLTLFRDNARQAPVPIISSRFPQESRLLQLAKTHRIRTLSIYYVLLVTHTDPNKPLATHGTAIQIYNFFLRHNGRPTKSEGTVTSPPTRSVSLLNKSLSLRTIIKGKRFVRQNLQCPLGPNDSISNRQNGNRLSKVSGIQFRSWRVLTCAVENSSKPARYFFECYPM